MSAIKTDLIFILLFFVYFPTIGQTDTTYIYQLGGIQSEDALDFIQSSDGGFVLVGTSGSNSQNLSDIYVTKLDSAFQCEWNIQLGSSLVDKGTSVCENNDGEFLVCGYSATAHGNGYDVRVAKLSNNGEVIWNRQYGGSDWDFAYRIMLHPISGYMLCGQTFSFGSNGDGYFLHLDDDGNLLQEIYIGDEGQDAFLDIDSDQSAEIIYLSGFFTPHDSSSYYRTITAIDYDGNTLWKSVQTTGGVSSYFRNTEIVGELLYSAANYLDDSNKRLGIISAIHKTDGSLFYNNFEVHNGDFVLNDLTVLSDQIIMSGFTNAYGDGNDNGIITVKDIFGNYLNSITIGANRFEFNKHLVSDGLFYAAITALNEEASPSYQSGLFVYEDLSFDPQSQTEWVDLGCYSVGVKETSSEAFTVNRIQIFDLAGRLILETDNIESKKFLEDLELNVYLEVGYSIDRKYCYRRLFAKQ